MSEPDSSGRFVMMNGARLLRSGLTGRVYAVTRWKVRPNGSIEAVKKFDVTDEFEALINEKEQVK